MSAPILSGATGMQDTTQRTDLGAQEELRGTDAQGMASDLLRNGEVRDLVTEQECIQGRRELSTAEAMASITSALFNRLGQAMGDRHAK
jgi:hypothetical protein